MDQQWNSDAAWSPDGKGFFYSRYPEPKAGEKFTALTYNMMLYYHRLGTSQADDVLVYKRPDHPDWSMSGSPTEDGRYLIIEMHKGTDARNRVTYRRDLSEPLAMPVDLIEDFDNDFSFVGNDGPVFYFKTDYKAPRGRLIAIDIVAVQALVAARTGRRSSPRPRTTLLRCCPDRSTCLSHSYLKDAKTQGQSFTDAGRHLSSARWSLPGLHRHGERFRRQAARKSMTFYTFSSYATPPSIYRYDLVSGKSKLLRQAKVKFQADEYEVKQVFYTSKDSTKVPMFISLAKKGIKAGRIESDIAVRLWWLQYL